ncbi:MAG: GNAT family N-acetyltransferase [Burkholderiaceae bacterium]
MTWPLRPYRPGDAEALAALFRASARVLGAKAYSPAHVEAWARHPEDLDEFRTRLGQGTTLVALDGDSRIGFGQLNPADTVEFLYVAPTHARRAVAQAIYDALEAQARELGTATLHAAASRLSKPFFEKNGWHVVAIDQVARFGVVFERYRMRKALDRP